WGGGGGARRRAPHDRRTRGQGGEDLLKFVEEKAARPAAAILEPEGESPRITESRNGRRHERKSHGLRHLGRQLLVQTIHNGARGHLRRGALVPGLEPDEEEALVTGGNTRQQAEADNGAVVLHALGLAEHRLDLVQYLIRPGE